MEEQVVQLCENCNREIPFENYLTHSVHCARNIRPCPICKEAVPVAYLHTHHKEKHEMSKSVQLMKKQNSDNIKVPCKNCGEKIAGTDMEDHLRDSCGHTVRTCRYCHLDLPRLTLPEHEDLCGSQTDKCPDCHEWIMSKYRDLHLESNHSFIRLNEDTFPRLRKPQLEQNQITQRKLKKTIPATATSNQYARNDINQPGPSHYNNGNFNGNKQGHFNQNSGKKTPKKNTTENNEGGLYQSIMKYMPFVKEVEAFVKDSRATMDRQNSVIDYLMQQKQFEESNGARRKELSNLKPMNEEQFKIRLSGLNIGPSPRNNDQNSDRINNIKSSLRDLRKDLNEVTAPYNSYSVIPPRYVNEIPVEEEGASAMPPQQEYPKDGRVYLPCEFCNSLIHEERLIEHETGCRPDLAKLNPYDGHPLIPCEICIKRVPMYLFKEHQVAWKRSLLSSNNNYNIMSIALGLAYWLENQSKRWRVERLFSF